MHQITFWSNVPIRILQPGELRGRKTSSSFCCPIRSGGASIPPWTLWSSRFLSCGAASVEFTSSRYSELWNWTGHFQKETKNFFNAAVADSASEVSMHQRRYTNTRYYYYYYYILAESITFWQNRSHGTMAISRNTILKVFGHFLFHSKY